MHQGCDLLLQNLVLWSRPTNALKWSCWKTKLSYRSATSALSRQSSGGNWNVILLIVRHIPGGPILTLYHEYKTKEYKIIYWAPVITRHGTCFCGTIFLLRECYTGNSDCTGVNIEGNLNSDVQHIIILHFAHMDTMKHRIVRYHPYI